MAIEKETRRFGVEWEDYPYVQASKLGERCTCPGKLPTMSMGNL